MATERKRRYRQSNTSSTDSKCWNRNLNCGKRRSRSIFATIQYLCFDQVRLPRETEPWRCHRTKHWILGETDTAWSFGDNDEDINKFITTCDSDHNEGYSKCSFVKSPAGYGLFSGTLDSKVPITGNLKRAGYCNITSPRAVVSGSFLWSSHAIQTLVRTDLELSFTEIIPTFNILRLEPIQYPGHASQRRWTSVHDQYLVGRLFRFKLEWYVPTHAVHERRTTLASLQGECWRETTAREPN